MKGQSGSRVKKWLFLILAIAAAFIISILAYVQMHTIHLNRYLVAEYSGYDGFGEADVTLDYVKLQNDFGKKLIDRPDSSVSGEAGISYEVQYVGENYVEHFDRDLTPNDSLSNGDKIRYSPTIKRTYDPWIGCWIEAHEEIFSVQGLPSVNEADPFAGIKLVYIGGNSEGTATVLKEDVDQMFELYGEYEIQPASHLSNGDKVVVTLTEDSRHLLKSKYGFTNSDVSKIYTVSGLPEITEEEHTSFDEWEESESEESEDLYSSGTGTHTNSNGGGSLHSGYSSNKWEDDPDYQEGDEDLDGYDDGSYYDEDFDMD